ncbi:MAG: protein-glutamate methylesterase/protein-glutamine glutaminase [Opitutaceae bacterium]
MRKIRVLVVDDAVVVRKIVTEILTEDPDIEVVGVAANGRIALAKISQLSPDIVTLDVEMPEMDGIETLAALRKTHPKLPVIMFSTLTERGASATLDALSRGANDYVTKPANVGSVAAGLDRVRTDLLPKIKSLCPGLGAGDPSYRGTRASGPAQGPFPAGKSAGADAKSRRPNPPQRIDALVIGVSTGGPNALAAMLASFPASLAIPVLIVQHMPPMFTRMLAERLSATCSIPVTEAGDGEKLSAGRAWIAPGNFHMEVARSGPGVRIVTHQGPHENSCRPAVDVLFRSAVSVYGPHVLGVVLTGMGQDGYVGCQTIHGAGGQCLAQDEKSSVVWGMPGIVARSGLADAVLPLEEMAGEIVRRVQRFRPLSSLALSCHLPLKQAG